MIKIENMTATIGMLKLLLTGVITYIVIGLCVWFFKDSVTSFRECLKDDMTLALTFTIGWIPVMVVGFDVFENDY